jgi:tetratricopeptide (TPR) repeat protein
LVWRQGGVDFGLKNYDQSIEWARQAIAINPNYVQYIHSVLVAALALTGHDAEAREALQRYLALPSTGPLKTIAAWKAYYSAQGGDPPPRRGERAGVRRPTQGRDARAVSAALGMTSIACVILC